MIILTTEDRANSAELAFEMVLGAYVALVHIHEAAFPGQYLALSPTMREFLADNLRHVEVTMAEGRMSAHAFEDAVQRLHTAMQDIEDDLRALAPT